MQKGAKVKFIGCSEEIRNWGGNDDPNGLLNTTDVYTVKEIEVHSWHTKVYLEGIEGKFNSVCFECIEEA